MATSLSEPMAKKRSEVRKNGAMIRISDDAHVRASHAARMMNMSLADYASSVLLTQAEKDIKTQARILGGDSSK